MIEKNQIIHGREDEMEQKIQEKSDIYNEGIELMYGISDKPKLSLQILLGLQHIFAAFGGIIVVPLVISICV